jgi:hypothetical protein
MFADEAAGDGMEIMKNIWLARAHAIDPRGYRVPFSDFLNEIGLVWLE